MLERARKIESQLIAWRHDFHQQPELAFQETRTAAKVASALQPLGYRLQTAVARTGVIAERGEGHPIIALRADMDALPIEEANNVPYASQIAGMMHACGHDAHTSILLGVASLLAEETFPGTIRLLFQPAEEAGDEEGISGAPYMVRAGVMDGVCAVLALHVDPTIDVGDIALNAGPVFAGVDTFYASIIGRGGHGAYPQQSIDPIYISAFVIQAIHGIVSRRIHPRLPAVISIGSIHGGKADNVIPERVELSGTIRFFAPEVQRQLHAEIERALNIARAMGADYTLKMEIGYQPMINNEEVASLIKEEASHLLGADHVLIGEAEMGAEDFGAFTTIVPGAMFRLGCRLEGGERFYHSPHFDLDEGCLPIGVALLTHAALRLLKQE